MTAAFTTRSEAESVPARVVLAMAEAGYEATRTHSFPKWSEVTEGYRRDTIKATEAGLKAARALGYSMVKS